MLSAISIRDVVLIEKLDLVFGAGLTALTGETGAGKSILLDSLGLALGGRADAGLVRAGAAQASVSAAFLPGPNHPALALLTEQGLDAEDALVLRRVVGTDGKSRAFVNDQPVGVALLRRLGATLVEVQGQNDQIGLADPASHAALLDGYGVPAKLRGATSTAWRALREADTALHDARRVMEDAAREEDWLRHTVDELSQLAPEPGEEDRLAAERTKLQQNERSTEAVAAALAELAPREKRGRGSDPGPASALRAAARALARLPQSGDAAEDSPAAAASAAIERAEEAVAEAETLLSRLVDQQDADPRRLEQTEERLFALRAAARKHNVAVVELPGLLTDLRARLDALVNGTANLHVLEQAARAARATYTEAATALTDARSTAATKLERAVTRELPPLRLDKARFHVEVAPLQAERWGAAGADSVRFLIATNPGQAPGALDRVASGGELSRLMLALKVVLVSGSAVPTLVFDEVDAGVGGATAAAVGDRLARVADTVQVLVVTHSPQVAARGAAHLRVSKSSSKGRAETRVDPLDLPARREELARMLAGETITEAARAAADSLLSPVAGAA